MNRIELEAAIAERTNLNKKVVIEVVQALLDTVTDTLAQGDPVRITNFATIAVKDRAERSGKNPKTGANITIAASRKVSLRAGKDLVRAVNAR